MRCLVSDCSVLAILNTTVTALVLIIIPHSTSWYLLSWCLTSDMISTIIFTLLTLNTVLGVITNQGPGGDRWNGGDDLEESII